MRLREAIKLSRKEGREEGRVESLLEVTQKLLKKGMEFKSISDIRSFGRRDQDIQVNVLTGVP